MQRVVVYLVPDLYGDLASCANGLELCIWFSRLCHRLSSCAWDGPQLCYIMLSCA